MQSSTRLSVMGFDWAGRAFTPDALREGAWADVCPCARSATRSGKTPMRAVFGTSKVSCANRRAQACAHHKVILPPLTAGQAELAFPAAQTKSEGRFSFDGTGSAPNSM